jgi:hypothetical protein
MQAYLDETDEPGLFVAIDWEKAYDRASWRYKADAYRNLGFGPAFRAMVEIISNEHQPPFRRVVANGCTSSAFSIFSGVPQGCPFSPLDFLVVLEALARAVKAHKRIIGITIDDIRHILTQFADDTLFFLKTYGSLGPLWALIFAFEKASGMKTNMPKTIGIRGGAFKRQPIPSNPEYHTGTMKFLKEGEWTKLLGIPFWEGESTDDFWEELYLKIKAIVAKWRRHTLASPVGRAMLANFMIYTHA